MGIFGLPSAPQVGFLLRKASLSKGIRHQIRACHTVSRSSNGSRKIGHFTANFGFDDKINQTNSFPILRVGLGGPTGAAVFELKTADN